MSEYTKQGGLICISNKHKNAATQNLLNHTILVSAIASMQWEKDTKKGGVPKGTLHIFLHTVTTSAISNSNMQFHLVCGSRIQKREVRQKMAKIHLNQSLTCEGHRVVPILPPT